MIHMRFIPDLDVCSYPIFCAVVTSHTQWVAFTDAFLTAISRWLVSKPLTQNENCSSLSLHKWWFPEGYPGYPQIIHLYPFIGGIFHYKPSIFGYPPLWKPPNLIAVIAWGLFRMWFKFSEFHRIWLAAFYPSIIKKTLVCNSNLNLCLLYTSIFVIYIFSMGSFQMILLNLVDAMCMVTGCLFRWFGTHSDCRISSAYLVSGLLCLILKYLESFRFILS